jgi:hypothetical protein
MVAVGWFEWNHLAKAFRRVSFVHVYEHLLSVSGGQMSAQVLLNPALRVYRTLNLTTGEVVREFAPLPGAETGAFLARAQVPNSKRAAQ